MKNTVILIPSYEPDDLLVDVVLALKNEDFPILLVNDGSGPKFNNVFDEVKDKVEYLEFKENKGKGAAMKFGYKNISNLFPDAKYVITVDGDGQHSIKDIIRVYEKLNETDQLVFGVRKFGNDIPLKSKIGNKLSRFNRSLLTKQYIQDDQCGLRGFPVRYIPELLKIVGDRYEYEMNQLVRFQMMQAPIHTIEIETIYLDNNSRSHFSPLSDTIRIQSIIFAHAIPALISNLILIAMMILLYHFAHMHIITVTSLSYLAIILLYFAYLSIFHPTKFIARRILKELLFGAIKMEMCNYLLFLTVGLLGWNYFAMIPVAVLIIAPLNVLLSWVLRKLFPSF